MATVTNISAAADIPDVYTITIGGTWADTDTLTISCGNRDVVITIGSTTAASTSLIAAEVAAILQAKNRRDGVADDCSWTHGAIEYGEFLEIKNVSVAGSVVTVEGPPGIPITITGSETSTSGTVTVANPQAATGKYFWDNTDNWDTGSLPTNGDTIVFDSQSVGARYGFPGTPIDPVEIKITGDFTGVDRWIGLPEINRQNPNYPYYEYRDRFIQFDDNTNESGSITIGGGSGPGPSLCNIDWVDTDTITVNVTTTGQPIPSLSKYPVNIKGSGTTFDVQMGGGQVAIAGLTNEAATINSVVVSSESAGSPAHLYLGPSVATSSATLTQFGGTVLNDSSATIGTVTIHSGTHILGGQSGATYSSVFVYAGATLVVRAAATLGMFITGGTVDVSEATGTVTFTSTIIYAGSTLLDPYGALDYNSSSPVLTHCGFEDVTLKLGRNISIF